ncbi:prolactin-like [Podarcis raffonei]|uniref:prolactin-like n=1 Tax=Podarcis raffonei TaxID=65483 RepID=UPI0023294658|nr:prolactin-like [Podarcis raffonei]
MWPAQDAAKEGKRRALGGRAELRLVRLRRRRCAIGPPTLSALLPPGVAWPVLLLLWALEKPLGGGCSVAECAGEDADCRFLAVADLFDRVILHSSRIYRLSTALHLDLVGKYFLPGGNELTKSVGKCHTSWLLTPNAKEYVQKMPREELTQLILRLLQAWKEPLSHFDQSRVHRPKLSDGNLHKAKEISNMVQELETGVEKITEKMQSMGIFSNSLSGVGSSEAAGLSINNEGNLMSDYEFIHCFRRDSNKVQNYLKVLKCRIVPANSC